MKWVFELYREYLEKECKQSGGTPTEALLGESFEAKIRAGSLKILVQEPWMGTIRFKALAVHDLNSPEMQRFYENPMEYLLHRFGSGKFKVNFYQGMHFVATKNFKPQGEQSFWQNIPEVVED